MTEKIRTFFGMAKDFFTGKEKVKITGITKKWLMNFVLVSVILICVVAVFGCVAFRSYYYNMATIALESKYSNLVTNYFSNYVSGTDEIFLDGSRKFVQDFSDKNTIEVWILDNSGMPIVSSSGMEIDKNAAMPDYTEALNNGKGRAVWTGKNENGEKIKAFSVLLSQEKKDGTYVNNAAVRYIVSLEYIDEQLSAIYNYIFIISVVIILLIFISGRYFIKSIVNPMNYICETVSKVAHGDFNARLEYTGDDEIQQLCTTINTMVKDISDTDKLKNDFISTISHEIRTPLTAIKGWGETLSQIGDTDPVLLQKGMNVIISESERLSGLVEDLLDFSRMQNGALKLKCEKIDVLAELDEAVFVFKDRAVREGIELLYNAPDEPAPMMGDGNRITQVFTNVLDNAMKYTEQGGKVAVRAEISPENRLVISVSDTGCGIAPEDLPRVKEKFYKTSINYRGSGIGLAVADEIIKMHRGEILISSVLGEGTTVKIVLPIELSQSSKMIKETETDEKK